jgi:hypothetical protein
LLSTQHATIDTINKSYDDEYDCDSAEEELAHMFSKRVTMYYVDDGDTTEVTYVLYVRVSVQVAR